jgi:hypothetical protein
MGGDCRGGGSRPYTSWLLHVCESCRRIDLAGAKLLLGRRGRILGFLRHGIRERGQELSFRKVLDPEEPVLAPCEAAFLGRLDRLEDGNVERLQCTEDNALASTPMAMTPSSHAPLTAPSPQSPATWKTMSEPCAI